MKPNIAHAAKNIFRAAVSQKKARIVWVLVGFFVLFLLPFEAKATFFDGILNFLSGILFFFANILGKLTVLLFGVLVQVAQYNDFINAQAVTIGWRILRDLANMLFILVLLVIAFGTAFRIQQYRYNALLRQLIIMAVLINFSKLITGFFIDLVQVIMMTFVNAFADTAAGNLTTAFGLDQILKLNTSIPGDQVTSLSIAGTLLLGVIMIAVMFVVTLIFVVIFLARIIFLWILTILSPMAYLFSTFPSTKKYWNQWWTKFWQYAMIGPILAFFLWLTLSITAAGNAAFLLSSNKVTQSDLESGGKVTAAISEVGSQTGILSFLVATLLLVFSLKTAGDFSVVGGSWAAGVGNSMAKNGVKALRSPFELGGRIARGTAGAALGVAGAGAAAAGSSLYQRSGLEGKLYGAAGSLARSKIPLVNRAGVRLQNRMGAATEKRREEAKKSAAGYGDYNTIGAVINRRAFTPRAVAEKEALMNRNPSAITDPAEFKKRVTGMDAQTWAATSMHEKIRAINKLNNMGAGNYLHEIDPDKARAIIQNPTLRRQLGYDGWKYDKDADSIVAPGGGTGVGVAPASLQDPLTHEINVPGYNPVRPMADVDKEKYDATEQAIHDKFKGNAEAFYKDPQYLLRKDQFLDRENFFAAFEDQQLRQHKLERGETRLEQLTGVNSAIRKGSKGESVNLAMDFAEGAAMGLQLSGAAGANLTGAEKQKAAAALTEKYKQQEQEKEIARRQEEMQEQADREHTTKGLLETAESGSIKSAKPIVGREEAAAQVAADAKFQGSLQAKTNEFSAALANAESINLVNKSRTGRSARQVLRHEQAHDAVAELTPDQKKEMWDQLAPERQKEISNFIRTNWAGGDKMSLQQMQEEYFTEAYASFGKSKHVGPLSFTGEKEEAILGGLDANLAYNKLEKSRGEVDRLPDDGLRELYKQLPEQRKQDIARYVRSNRENGHEFTDDDVMKEFFSQSLAAQRGGSVDGPLAFTNDEREMALLLHAAGSGKAYTPAATGGARAAAASAPVSVAEVSKKPTPPPTTAAPAGSRRVIAQPATRVVESRPEAPISPVVKTTVINNTNVQNAASDLSRQIAGKVDAMPTRQNLLQSLGQLQSAIVTVARAQGVNEKELQNLTAEMGVLREDLQNTSTPKDDKAIQASLRAFVKKIRKETKSAQAPDDSENSGLSGAA